VILLTLQQSQHKAHALLLHINVNLRNFINVKVHKTKTAKTTKVIIYYIYYTIQAQFAGKNYN